VGDWFRELDPIAQAALAGCFTWSITAAGAAGVFLFRSMSRVLLDTMLGFAAGVMIAASIWSLLLPAIELARNDGHSGWAQASAGLLLGGFALRIADATLPHLHVFTPLNRAEGRRTAWRRATLLVFAITLHNIPEGLAVGVAFGAAERSQTATLAAAIALAVGIGLQNFPEGIAVAMPLRGENVSRRQSFWYGQLSAAVEPVAAAAGAAAIVLVSPMLPYALAFAAGAMLYVVVEELIPESHAGDHPDLATSGALLGFTLMMVLDVALG
jgi:ZIP family zinc transporter